MRPYCHAPLWLRLKIDHSKKSQGNSTSPRSLPDNDFKADWGLTCAVQALLKKHKEKLRIVDTVVSKGNSAGQDRHIKLTTTPNQTISRGVINSELAETSGAPTYTHWLSGEVWPVLLCKPNLQCKNQTKWLKFTQRHGTGVQKNGSRCYKISRLFQIHMFWILAGTGRSGSIMQCDQGVVLFIGKNRLVWKASSVCPIQIICIKTKERKIDFIIFKITWLPEKGNKT